MIRDAQEADLPGILAIYNEVLATSTAIYTEQPATLDERKAWFLSRRAQSYPVLVFAQESAVEGFATFGDFRARPGYRFTVEHTVHVHCDCRGTGIGQALVRALFPHARRLGKHVMLAGVDAANDRSIRFHERLGFGQVARFREVGWKFDRWLDLVFLQRMLSDDEDSSR